MISSEASLQLFDYVLLGLAALGTSVISGFMGMAGGILLLVIMAEFFVPHLLIPLHGVVQLGSNASRVALLFRQVNHQVMVQFVLGALIGVLLGSQLVVAIPEDQFRLLLGGFILVLTWMPKTNAIPRFRLKFFFLGGFATFASLFIGATGPLLAPFFIRENFGKKVIVATKAAAQTCVHSLKVATYLMLGFSILPYWKLLVLMLVCVVIGNAIGKQILEKISQDLFVKIFKVLITVLALRMVFLSIV